MHNTNTGHRKGFRWISYSNTLFALRDNYRKREKYQVKENTTQNWTLHHEKEKHSVLDIIIGDPSMFLFFWYRSFSYRGIFLTCFRVFSGFSYFRAYLDRTLPKIAPCLCSIAHFEDILLCDGINSISSISLTSKFDFWKEMFWKLTKFWKNSQKRCPGFFQHIGYFWARKNVQIWFLMIFHHFGT